MGGKQSRRGGHYPSSYDYGPPPIPNASPYYPSYSSNYVERDVRSRLQKKYTRIPDNYNSIEQVTDALAQSGLESSNLIVGIDFTKSNEWTGARSFDRRSLHHLGDSPNPYEQAISIIGRTLSAFDEDNLIPCFGFGDASTHDQEVFSFYPDNRPCNGFEEALTRYRELVPRLRLAGPTSFAPIIETAIGIVDNSGGQYHVLMIIADGQVTRSIDTEIGQLSPQEHDTINAIVKASDYPLSIVLVGVGDGPWDMMRQFDDNIPARAFDNFQFVNFTELMSRNIPASKKETEFAVSALMEIPSQYKATLELQLLGRRKGIQERIPIPPPIVGYNSGNSSSRYSRSSSFEYGTGYHNNAYTPADSTGYNSTYTPPEEYPSRNVASQRNNQTCPVCFWNAKDLAFGCGHQTCYDCGRDLLSCPICRAHISTRIKLY